MLRSSGLLARSVFGRLFAALSLVMLACYLTVHAAGLLAYEVAEEQSNASITVARLPVFVMMVPLYAPWPFGPWDLFICLFALYSLLFAFLAIAGGSNAIAAVRKALTEGPKALLDNALWGVAMLSTASIVAMVALQRVQEPVLPTGELEFPSLLVEYLSASWAPLAEEIGFRMTVIGLLVVLACGRYATAREKLLGLLYPWKLRPKIGALLDVAIAAGIVLTSVPFGLLHVLAGWGPGKATIAMLAGVTLGYLYARYSIAASIMAHWTYNYYTETVRILANVTEIAGFPAFLLLVYGLASLGLVAYTLSERLLVRAK